MNVGVAHVEVPHSNKSPPITRIPLGSIEEDSSACEQGTGTLIAKFQGLNDVRNHGRPPQRVPWGAMAWRATCVEPHPAASVKVERNLKATLYDS